MTRPFRAICVSEDYPKVDGGASASRFGRYVFGKSVVSGQMGPALAGYRIVRPGLTRGHRAILRWLIMPNGCWG